MQPNEEDILQCTGESRWRSHSTQDGAASTKTLQQKWTIFRVHAPTGTVIAQRQEWRDVPTD
jgi:hypothetical protein